jgi:hypothetical protein
VPGVAQVRHCAGPIRRLAVDAHTLSAPTDAAAHTSTRTLRLRGRQHPFQGILDAGASAG